MEHSNPEVAVLTVDSYIYRGSTAVLLTLGVQTPRAVEWECSTVKVQPEWEPFEARCFGLWTSSAVVLGHQPDVPIECHGASPKAHLAMTIEIFLFYCFNALFYSRDYFIYIFFIFILQPTHNGSPNPQLAHRDEAACLQSDVEYCQVILIETSCLGILQVTH